MNKKSYDIVIVGGGHAGCEAAWIASQFSELKICIISSPDSGLASAPCNPAIGGVGKGQVVRELDTMGGLMPVLADLAGIQFRTLNESKGYAVQSTRVQIDKDRYSEFAEEILGKVPNLDITREMVSLIRHSDEGFEIVLSDCIVFCRRLIVTTGTFLNGKLHTGEVQTTGGRVGCRNSVGLNDLFAKVKTNEKRFKTGTPPRLKASSLDFSVMTEQESDPSTRNFSMRNRPFDRNLKQVSCFLTNTNSKTLSLIRANKERSPIFNGQIQGVGPRYCPSIEDKAFRYPDKDSHHVFIEPETSTFDSIYPNGISTSLPADVQVELVRSIQGLEYADILVNGYAVEYDVVETSALSLTLEYKDIVGLYFAGQVNGTSGYEEAAGQGFIAGANAALSLLSRNPLILPREISYIGVMIEDLVTNKRDEPYRLFTARSENRLYIREDNSIERLADFRRDLGINNEIDEFNENFLSECRILHELVKSYWYYSNSTNKDYFFRRNYGPLDTNITLSELIKRPDLDPINVLSNECISMGANFSIDVVRTVAIASKYEGYINRATEEFSKLKRLDHKKISWSSLVENQNISYECRLRIGEIRPETFGQLQRMNGVRPATLAYVAGTL